MFQPTVYDRRLLNGEDLQHFPAETFPDVRPIHWLHSHFAVGGWSPLQRLSGMITAHMTEIVLLPVAWTKGTDFKPAARPPVAEITYLDTYKQPIA